MGGGGWGGGIMQLTCEIKDNFKKILRILILTFSPTQANI